MIKTLKSRIRRYLDIFLCVLGTSVLSNAKVLLNGSSICIDGSAAVFLYQGGAREGKDHD